MSTEPDTDVSRLRNAIACELNAQLALRDERLELADLPEVAYAVAVQLQHTFRIEWAPRWTDQTDETDWLSPDAATYHAP